MNKSENTRKDRNVKNKKQKQDEVTWNFIRYGE